MKKITRKIVVLLILSLTITSISAVGVSAEVKKPWMVQNLTAHSGYKSVILTWKRSTQNIKGYRVYLKRPGQSNYKLIKTLDIARYPSLKNVKYCAYKVVNLPNYNTYQFRVKAYVNDSSGHALESAYKTVSAAPIREMRVRFNVKGTGRSLVANRFSGGVFITSSGERVSGVRVTNERAEYTRAFDYSALSAQYFVNDRGFSSKTNYLVWVSTYTQHAYLMRGSKGKWKCIDHWHCATGSASSPTPTGYNNVKTIYKKVRYRHDVSWWSPFSSWNSLHGRVGDSMSLGTPSSGGCVRNPDEKARFIYNNCKIGTTVIIY